ncbi:MAG TPA: 5-formyltetrahydrofolate cyclo-ligase [Planctomycetota bacterium]|nr:5-formyltetrahydrofolate cyclo-ligase [Planctomycetota bacterium]HRR78549.1 5-formyltetrahydrofolate cyclo-ligase [Planctomycetota bacterium]
MEKAQAREEIARRLAQLTAEQRREASRRIRRLVAELPEFQRARTVLLFVSLPDEADTLGLIADALAAGKAVAVPKVDRKRKAMDACRLHALDRGLAPGVFGIPEPEAAAVVEPGAIDFVLVPARGYDREGNRIGRGGGYYDRYMAHPGFHATRCGIAFAAQILDSVPHDAHDLPVEMLVTENGVLRFE